MRIRRIINLISTIVIIVFINLFAVRYYTKIDLTQNKIYTVSTATKKVIKRLKMPVDIKVVVSDDIPVPYNASVRLFLDILNEYKSIAKGKVKIEVINTDVEKAANLYGIPAVQVNAIENNGLQIRKIYMGAVIIYGDKTETIPVIANIKSPEYEFTTLIKRMSDEKKKSIAVLNFGESATTTMGLKQVTDVLSKNYLVEDVKIKPGELIDKKYDLAVLISPKKELNKSEVYALEEYLFSGKSVILAVDKVDGNIQTGVAYPKVTGLEDFLKKNGIVMKDELVYDANATMINVSRNAGGFIISTAIKYPFFPEIINFNDNLTFTKNVSTVDMIYPTVIEISNKSGVVPIMFSSEKSGIEKEPFNISLEREYELKDFDKSRIPLGFEITKKFVSEYEKPLEKYKDSFKKSGSGKLMLISDGEMFTDEFVPYADNLKLFVSMADYLLADPELMELRNKTFSLHPLTVTDPQTMIFYKYVILFLPPLLVLFFGFFAIKVLGKRRIRL